MLSNWLFFFSKGMLRNRLRGRGSQVLVGLGRYLRQQCSSEGLIDKIVLQQGMRAYHISLTPEVHQTKMVIAVSERHFDTENVWLSKCILCACKLLEIQACSDNHLVVIVLTCCIV